MTITLSPNDIGGRERADHRVQHRRRRRWQSGTSVADRRPADHSYDGPHTILYRSTDNAGNQEQTESLAVGVDTLGPACSAPRASVVNAGKLGVLYFKATDATSDVAQVTISVVNSRGHVVLKFVEHAGDWGMAPPLPYYWLRFKCTLQPGTYRVEVRATDWAGNPAGDDRPQLAARRALRCPGLPQPGVAGRPADELDRLLSAP